MGEGGGAMRVGGGDGGCGNEGGKSLWVGGGMDEEEGDGDRRKGMGQCGWGMGWTRE